MMVSSEVRRADRLIRHRAMLATVLGIMLIVTQQSRMHGASVAGWLIWGGLVLAFVVWASGLFQGRAFRRIVNDESSARHRERALAIGFWAMLASAAVCFALSFVKPYGPREAIQVIVTAGVSAAMLAFGFAERRALRP